MKNKIYCYQKIASLIVFMFFASTIDVRAQFDDYALTPDKLLPQFSKLSPEAASLGKYGTYNVSEYSGSPSIKIPLLTVKSSDVSFPIELYYDASGIKVEQDASFVGLGWNLSYGGCINHIVCGSDDFHEFEQNEPDYYSKIYNERFIPSGVPCGYFRQYSTFMTHILYEGDCVLCAPKDVEDFRLYYDLSKGVDTPDIFQANFCGHNLSFVIDKRYNNKIVILNDNSNKYKISYEKGDGGYSYPKSFIITDDKGINYVFEGFAEASLAQKDTYYLTKIYGADGMAGRSTITIEYKCLSCNLSNSRPSLSTNTTVGKYLGGDCPMELRSNLADLVGTHYYYNVNTQVQKIYPTKIITGTEEIDFILQERQDLLGTYAISGIQLKSKRGTILNRINLNYDYYKEKVLSSCWTHKRLRLTKVDVNSQKYQLIYNSSELPSFSSGAKDYWGFFNGQNNGENLCGTPKYILKNDTIQTSEYLGTANRYASEKLCKVGMLQRIIYPTGGYTNFDFELNRFNDEYYYPDASQQCIPDTIEQDICSVHVYETSGPKSVSQTISIPSESDYKLKIMLSTNKESNDISSLALKNKTTGKIIKELKVTNGENKSESYNLHLSKGVYVIDAVIKVGGGKYYSTTANCVLSHRIYKYKLIDSIVEGSKGGNSMGGGMRIKSIKNYDSLNNKFISGIEYEYKDGKLLIPTVRMETHYIDFSYVSDGGRGNVEFPKFSFSFANSEPSYLYICSFGIPATVGYSTVIKKEVDETGNVLKRTVLDYYNYGYEMNKGINSRNNNSMYYCTNGYLNGKLKGESIFSNKGKIYSSQFHYEKSLLESIVTPKCISTFLPGYFWKQVKFDLAFFRKDCYWTYLTQKDEIEYDSLGHQISKKTTTYDYNSTNYQPAVQEVSDGLNSQKVVYSYPSDSGNKSKGLSYLLDKHNLSEVTGMDVFRNNVYTGGSRYNYTLKNNLPVVNSCYSILSDSTEILQMKVTDYDSAGNIREYQKKDGTPVTILWSYSHQYPVMEIVGKKYSDVTTLLSGISQLENFSDAEWANDGLYSILKYYHDKMRIEMPDAHVTAYMYNAWHNVSRIINPNGFESHFEYDDFGRLIKAGDDTGTLQKYQYNYKIK